MASTPSRKVEAAIVQNLRLCYAKQGTAEELRQHIDVDIDISKIPFEFEAREWVVQLVGDDGFTVCSEHVRTFHVSVDGDAFTYTGPRPADGEILSLDSDEGHHVRVSDVAVAHHDITRGSFHGQRLEP